MIGVEEGLDRRWMGQWIKQEICRNVFCAG
jgi:hypothetical protein